MVKVGLRVAGFLCLCIVAALSLKLLWPSVTIKNETDERMYLHANEGRHNIEPSTEEMRKIMRTAPEVVEPGGRLKITPSWRTALTQADELYVGWSIGGRYSYNSSGGGQQRFRLNAIKGKCSITLRIFKGRNNFSLENKNGSVCFKKITPMTIAY